MDLITYHIYLSIGFGAVCFGFGYVWGKSDKEDKKIKFKD